MTHKLCTIDDCSNKYSCKGYCAKHYYRFLKHGSPHITKIRPKNFSTVCLLDNCEAPHKSKGYCNKHYLKLMKYGDASVIKHSPSKTPGRYITEEGYVRLYGYKGHPNAQAKGCILEHILIMSDHLGRPLIRGENVHHKNGIRDDNRIENLELWNKTQPAGQRAEDKVVWAIELLKLYKPEALAP